MRKLFLLALTVCMLLVTAVAQAAQITDVKWGVDKSNVLRLVVDITDTAGYSVELAGSKLKLTVNAKAAGQVPKVKKIKSTLADELRVVDGGSFTEVHLPLNRQIASSDYRAFVLKKDPQTGRPFRVVLDITADKTTGVVNNGAGSSSKATTKPSTGTTGKSAATVTSGSTNGGTAQVSNKPVVGSRPVKSAANEGKATTGTSEPKVVKAGSSSTSESKVVKAGSSSTSEPKVVKVGSSSTSEPKVVKVGSSSTSESKANVKTDKNSTATKEELPLAIKAKTKFRTGGGIKGKIITLDPGHGGSDPGAIGASGLKEKQITLEISMRVKELLEKEGAKVYMTRTTDKDVYGPNASDRAELQARVNVAEKYNSDLFVSLHINSSVNKSVGGFSSYYYPKTDNDLKIAKAIQDKFAKNFGVDNLGVRQANFYVVKRCSMPATLLEMCFISNPKEEKLMKSRWFQKKTARLIVEGVENYFD